jgi:hypothetical protein
MPATDAAFARWRDRRAARLAALPWLRNDMTHGQPARYVADQLLVRREHSTSARAVVANHSNGAVRQSDDAAGFQIIQSPGLDVPGAVRAIRSQVGDVSAAGPNHVFLSTPFQHGGPFGPATPIAAPAMFATPESTGAVAVTVIDTGIWAASALPSGWVDTTPADLDTTLDADADGTIDSDVAHANFIAGVVISRTTHARVRVVKVLDSLGVCTEAQLAQALLGVSDAAVVNLSLGGYTLDDQPPVALRSALGTLLSGNDRGVVAAAGNDATAGRPFWPAAFTTQPVPWAEQVFGVAAHDGTALCSWSNSGDWVTMAAPGLDITSFYVNASPFTSGWAQWSGTSFATPYVVGAIVERAAQAGGVLAAMKQVRDEAGAHSYSDTPGLA